MGVDQAWTFLVGEAFKAEHVVVAQPGATLTVCANLVFIESQQMFYDSLTGYGVLR